MRPEVLYITIDRDQCRITRICRLSALFALIFSGFLANIPALVATPRTISDRRSSETAVTGSARIRTLRLSAEYAPAKVGEEFRGILEVARGLGPYDFSLSWGQLAQGFSLDSKTGAVSGTAERRGEFEFGVHVTDLSGLGGEKAFEISVLKSDPAMVTLLPSTGIISSQGTLQFTAEVRNTLNVGVSWSYSPDTISSTGPYQARP